MSKYQADRKYVAEYFRWLIGVYRQRTQKARKMYSDYSKRMDEFGKKLLDGQPVDSTAMSVTADNVKIAMTSEYVNGELLLMASNMEVMTNWMITTSENVEDLVKTVDGLIVEIQKVRSLPEQVKQQLTDLTDKVSKHHQTYDSLQKHLEEKKQEYEENQKKSNNPLGDVYG